MRAAGERSISGKYFEALELVAEAAGEFMNSRRAVTLRRVLTKYGPARGKWVYYPWPPTDRVWRAVHAYALGLLSVPAPARVLNFWRAIEAVTTLSERRTLFDVLPSQKVALVWASEQGLAERTVNVAPTLKRQALKRYRHLVSSHGSPGLA